MPSFSFEQFIGRQEMFIVSYPTAVVKWVLHLHVKNSEVYQQEDKKRLNH